MSLNFILGMFSFWLKDVWYLPWYLRAFERLFGGTLVPLWFYPGFLYRISSLLPFRLITFEPINIYLGRVDHYESLRIMGLQVVWLVVLFTIERVMWNRARKKLTIYGG